VGDHHDAGIGRPIASGPERERRLADPLDRLGLEPQRPAGDRRQAQGGAERAGSSRDAGDGYAERAEHVAEHHVAREVLAGDGEGAAAGPFVVGAGELDRGRRLFDRRERVQALARREHVRETGLLGDHRSAGS
jgi:hypothetical protein